jgi:hypothetical protein
MLRDFSRVVFCAYKTPESVRLIQGLGDYRHKRSKRAGLVAVYLTVC